MNRKRLLKHLVFLMFFIFLVNSMSWQFSWYYLIWYLDIIMHFLGGLWVALFFIYVFSRKDPANLDFPLFLQIFIASSLVGVLWEFYEFFLTAISATSFNFQDTVFDVIFDMLGAIASFFFFFKNNYVNTQK